MVYVIICYTICQPGIGLRLTNGIADYDIYHMSTLAPYQTLSSDHLARPKNPTEYVGSGGPTTFSTATSSLLGSNAD